MKTNCAMKTYLVGKYILTIEPFVSQRDCCGIKKIEFEKLYDAVEYATFLTFEDCEKMNFKTSEKIDRYDINIFLKEDFWREDCLRKDGNTYPTIYHSSLRRTPDAKQNQ